MVLRGGGGRGGSLAEICGSFAGIWVSCAEFSGFVAKIYGSAAEIQLSFAEI